MQRQFFALGLLAGVTACALTVASGEAADGGERAGDSASSAECDRLIADSTARWRHGLTPEWTIVAGSVPCLLRALAEPQADARSHAAALLGIGAFYDDGTRAGVKENLPVIIGHLGDSDPRVREMLFRALSAVVLSDPRPSAKTIELIVAKMSDPDADVRRMALGLLARVDRPAGAGVDRALEMLRTDENGEVRSEAARFFEAMFLRHRRIAEANPRVLPALIDALDDPELAGTMSVVHALESAGGVAIGGVPALERIARENPEAVIRDDATLAICNISEANHRMSGEAQGSGGVR